MPVLFKWNVKLQDFMVKKVKIGKIKNLSMENIGFGAKFRGGFKRGIVKIGLNKSRHGKWSKERR